MTTNSSKKRAVALGYFDGLHIAHMAVLAKAVGQTKNGMVPTVLLFDVSPAFLFKGADTPRLLSEKKRDCILTEMGFDIVKISLAEIKDMSPREFFENILCKKLNSGYVCCGFNYSFGKNRAGDVDELLRLCDSHGIGCGVCSQITLNGQTVCSSAVRTAVENGNIELANAMLGRPFGFSAEVFSGDHRGRLLGAPTINQYMPSDFCVPLFGVYAAKVRFDGKSYNGVSNVGKRPTFGGESVRCETYILGFEGDLYGRDIEVEFYSFLRKEQRFDSFDLLKEQIARDVSAAERVLNNLPAN